MGYFFVNRPVPSPNYKYHPGIQKWEKLTAAQIKSVKFVGKPIRLGHKNNIDIGKVLLEWIDNEGSKISISYIDSDTPIGRDAIDLIKSGKIRYTSPKYKFDLKKTGPNSLLIDKEYIEVALVEEPDFPGDGGCCIFFGADENDLNIKSYSLLKNLHNQEDINKSSIGKKVGNIISDINQKSTIMAEHQTETTQQGSVAPVPSQQQPVVERVDDGITKINSVADLALAVSNDPNLAGEMNPDTLRSGILKLSKEYSDLLKRQATGQDVDVSNKRQKVDTPSDAPQQAQQQSQVQPTPNTLIDNTTKIAQQRVTQLMDLLNNTKNLNEVGPMINPETLKSNVQSVGDAIAKNPGNPLVPTLMSTLENMGTFVMAHAYRTTENDYGRNAVKTAERKITAGQIEGFLKSNDKPAMRQNTYQQTNHTVVQTQTGKYDMSEYEKNAMNSVIQNVLKRSTTTSHDMSTIPIKMEVNPLQFH